MDSVLGLMDEQGMEGEGITKIPTMVEKALKSFWRTQEFKVDYVAIKVRVQRLSFFLTDSLTID